MDFSAGIYNLFLGLFPILCVTAYIVILLYARRTWILQRNTAHLLAYIDTLDADLLAKKCIPNQTQDINCTIDEIDDLLKKARQVMHENNPSLWRSMLSLGGISHQIAAWRRAHDADQLATSLWPDERISAYALVAKEELKAIGSSAANALSEKIATLIEANKSDELRPHIREARRLIFNSRDTYYEELSDWQQKALWLVIVTGGIVLLLATADRDTVIYLMYGATGGLLARLAKTMSAKDIGFDYGVSWSILFLAPLVGALMGWAGVMISNFVLALDVLNLPDELFSKIAAKKGELSLLSDNSKDVLAILFGFSATLFEKVMSGAITTMTKKPVSSEKK